MAGASGHELSDGQEQMPDGSIKHTRCSRPSLLEQTLEFVGAVTDVTEDYGLALTAMSLLDAVKRTPEWTKDEAKCREHIQQSAARVARVIVPLCLSLPKKLPKPVHA